VSAPGQRVDPYANFNFLVEIDGITQGGFQECSGFDSAIDVIEHREGGDNLTPRKLAGMTKHAPITLKWGLTDNRDLYDWHRRAVEGRVERRNGSIVVQDNQGIERVRWNFVNAWPSKWTGASLNAEGTDVAVETLEIVHEGIVRA
jgi:phage tail-like protein